ncbi:MAG TPA: M20/M25/M40 family metallo-hydrolase [Longimicrobiales bacterium]|nr:M20/M25/M40 family metallo-hydrolase [Longimicrobiales bacterium]
MGWQRMARWPVVVTVAPRAAAGRARLTAALPLVLAWAGACASPAAPPAAPPAPAGGGPAVERPPAGDSPAAAGPLAAYVEEASSLATDPRVREAFRVVEALQPRTRRDHITLTEIPAPPFAEGARARHYAGMLREAGADTVWIDAEGNVLALRRGRTEGGALVLSGHLDTVFPEGTDVTVRVRGDTLHAPGVGDDTRGLMVVLTVLRAMEAAGLETERDVLFVGTVGEEGLGDLRGVKHLFRDGGPAIASFISIDGSGDERVTHQALGSRRYRAIVGGPGGHSWGAFGTANPAHALGRAIRLFDERAAAYVAEGPRTSYNVGVIGGGTSVNSVPFEAWMEVDMRSVDDDRLRGIDALFRRTVREAVAAQSTERARGDSLTVELRLVGDRPSGEIAPDDALVQRAMAAIARFGLRPAPGRSSTDANIPISRGIPAVTLGGGGEGSGAHSLHEWWLDRDSHIAIQRTLLVVLAQAGLAGS